MRPLRPYALGVDGWPCVYITEPGLIEVPGQYDLAYLGVLRRQTTDWGRMPLSWLPASVAVVAQDQLVQSVHVTNARASDALHAVPMRRANGSASCMRLLKSTTALLCLLQNVWSVESLGDNGKYGRIDMGHHDEFLRT